MHKHMIRNGTCVGQFGRYWLFMVEAECGEEGIAWVPVNPRDARENGALVQWNPEPGMKKVDRYTFEELQEGLQLVLIASELAEEIDDELSDDLRHQVFVAAQTVIKEQSHENFEGLTEALHAAGNLVDPKYLQDLDAFMDRIQRGRMDDDEGAVRHVADEYHCPGDAGTSEPPEVAASPTPSPQ